METKRIILEDKFESFMHIVNDALAGNYSSINLYTIRFNKKDNVNYDRLMGTVNFLDKISKQRVHSYYLFLEKHRENIIKQLDLTSAESLFILDQNLSKSVLLSKDFNETNQASVFFLRYTSPHRLLTERDVFFDINKKPIYTFVTTSTALFKVLDSTINLNLIGYQNPELVVEYQKLKESYLQDFLMSKMEFSSTVDSEFKDIILDQYEEITQSFLGETDAKTAFKKPFSHEAKLWVIERLELLKNA